MNVLGYCCTHDVAITFSEKFKLGPLSPQRCWMHYHRHLKTVQTYTNSMFVGYIFGQSPRIIVSGWCSAQPSDLVDVR